MRLAFGCVLALSCALVVAACGSDSKDEGTADTSDACEVGCVATLEADCSNGPATRAKCVSDCHMLEDGSCGDAYATFQACAKGEAVTCSAQGLPSVEACSDEQAAFVACLTQ